MSRLRKTVIPFSWNAITISFTQGTAGSVNLATRLVNPRNVTITYSVVGSLPTGVTLAGAIVSYNGTAAAAQVSVQFRATSGNFVAESVPTFVTITATPVVNTDPVWVTAADLGTISAGQAFNFNLLATDAESSPITFVHSPPAFGAAVAQTQSGANRTLVWSGNAPTTAGTYTFTVDVLDATPLGQVTGLTATAGTLSIALNWTGVLNATSYEVQRSATGTSNWTTRTTQAGVTYTDSGLTASTTYYYRVRALSATQQGEYSAAVGATTAGTASAQADWLARSTGPAVVWAHNFEHANEFLNFYIAPGNINDPSRSWDASHYTTDFSYEAGTGFAGGGCIVVTNPAADVAWERSVGIFDASVHDTGGGWYGQLRSAFGVEYAGCPFGRGQWVRPYSPLTTSGSDRTTGSGTGANDIANGVTRRTWTPWTNANQQAAFHDGLYSHADYTPPTGWTRDGDEFWLQMRMKVPMERYYSTRMIPAYTGAAGSRFFTNTSPYRARQAAGKFHWIGVLTEYGSQAQEIVLSSLPRISIAEGDSYDTTTWYAKVYTAFGPEFFTSNNPPWEFPADQWVTILYHIKYGHDQNTPGPTGGDSTVEMFASINGSAYVTLGSTTQARIDFATGTPFGSNALQLTTYNNAVDSITNAGVAACRDPAQRSSSAASARYLDGDSYSIRYTQIIFSRAWIPPPAVGA
jgi:hypothetical protein